VPQFLIREIYFENRRVLFHVDDVFVRLIACNLDIGRYFICTAYNYHQILLNICINRFVLIE